MQHRNKNKINIRVGVAMRHQIKATHSEWVIIRNETILLLCVREFGVFVFVHRNKFYNALKKCKDYSFEYTNVSGRVKLAQIISGFLLL